MDMGGRNSRQQLCVIHRLVSLEETFKIEVPDEYLMVSAMNTITKMVDVVTSEIEKKAK